MVVESLRPCSELRRRIRESLLLKAVVPDACGRLRMLPHAQYIMLPISPGYQLDVEESHAKQWLNSYTLPPAAKTSGTCGCVLNWPLPAENTTKIPSSTASLSSSATTGRRLSGDGGQVFQRLPRMGRHVKAALGSLPLCYRIISRNF